MILVWPLLYWQITIEGASILEISGEVIGETHNCSLIGEDTFFCISLIGEAIQ